MNRVRNGTALIVLALLLLVGVAGGADQTSLTPTHLGLAALATALIWHGTRLIEKGERT